jgi:hypothetical protein
MPFKYNVKNITNLPINNHAKTLQINNAIAEINAYLSDYVGDNYYDIRSDLLEHMNELFVLKTESALFEDSLGVLNEFFEMEPEAMRTREMIQTFITRYSQYHIDEDVVVFAVINNQNDRFIELFSTINSTINSKIGHHVQHEAARPSNHYHTDSSAASSSATSDYFQDFAEFLSTLTILQKTNLTDSEQLENLAKIYGDETTYAMAIHSGSFTFEELHNFELLHGLLGG